MHAALRSASRTALTHSHQPTPVIARSTVARTGPSSSVVLGARGYASKGKRTKKATESAAGTRSSDVNSGPADAEASAAGQSPFEAPPPPENAGTTSAAKKAAADAADKLKGIAAQAKESAKEGVRKVRGFSEAVEKKTEEERSREGWRSAAFDVSA